MDNNNDDNINMYKSINYNGRIIKTTACNIYELSDELNVDRQNKVIIKNGYQTDENLKLSDGDIVTIIQKGVMPDKEQLKEMMRARHTPGVYDAVKDAKVAIMGLGGLGSNIAIMLARTGVGHLKLVDFDIVEPSNLNRQQYSITQLGKRKTDALKEIINQINPFLDIKTEFVRVTEKNVLSITDGYDIVCEAFDKPDAKVMLTQCILSQTDKVLIAASGMAGIEDSNAVKTRKVTDRFYVCGDGMTEAKEGRGLMAPRVTICAAHQANAVLDVIIK